MQRLCLLCATIVVLAGCGGTPQSQSTMGDPMTAAEPGPIVTPADTTNGRVSLANAQGRYVVLTFPIGTLPEANRQLDLYRDGLKVGEVRVTGPQRDNNTVADLLAGEARVGDEVR